MAFDTARFWPAYKRAGMLDQVKVVEPAGPPDFDGRLEAPTALFVDGMAQAEEITLQYPTSTPVSLTRGNRILCKGRSFQVLSDTPALLQDGWLSQVSLQEIFP